MPDSSGYCKDVLEYYRIIQCIMGYNYRILQCIMEYYYRILQCIMGFYYRILQCIIAYAITEYYNVLWDIII